MKYDFDSVIDRNGTGAAKWMLMNRQNPNVEKGVIPFSVADMELLNPPEIIQGLKTYLDQAVLGYTLPTQGYIESVCGWMQRRHGWKIQPDWIIQWPGIVPALYDLVKMLTAPGEGVMIMTPVYYPFYEAVRSSGRNLLESPLKRTGTRYEIDYEILEQHAQKASTKLLILCNPHNPVGRCWTKEELERVGRICIDNNVLVISDEIHFDLIMPGFRHTVFASVSEELAQNSIICTAPSKTFNLAGLQTSNIIIPNQELCEKVREAHKNDGFFSLNALAYVSCEIAYTKCEEWLKQLIQLIARNRDLVESYLEEFIPAIKPVPMEATYLQWLDCRELGMEPKEMEQFMQMEAQLFLDEGYIFGESGAGFERINLACPTSALEQALGRLKSALEKRKSKVTV